MKGDVEDGGFVERGDEGYHGEREEGEEEGGSRSDVVQASRTGCVNGAGYLLGGTRQ